MNALSDGRSIPATVSFSVLWSGATARVDVRNTEFGFQLDGVQTLATIEWSASEAGFSFVSDPAATSTRHFAEVVHERNGVFFEPGD